MKRSKFMDSVSSGALTRKEISGAEFKWHEALSRVSKEFRERAKWVGPETSSSGDDQAVRMVRLPHGEPNPTEGVSLVFVDRTKHAGPPEEIALAAVRDLWGECLNHIRPMTPDFLKVGSVVLDDLDMRSEPDWAAGLLGLKKGDANIARALNSALIGTFISNPKKTDLEDIVVAIGNFIHALPTFSKLVMPGKWQPPYGNRTAYKLLR
jgi:hypothetical protein